MTPQPVARARRFAQEPEEQPPVSAELLHLFCHDFRVPLTTLAAYAELLRSPGLDPEQRGQFVEAIETQAGRVARMVADLEALALPPGPPVEPGETCADAIECIQGAIDEVAATAAARGARIQFSPGSGRLPLRVRPDQLQRGLAWLLEVGLRRVRAGGTIAVWTTTEPHATRIGVDTPLQAPEEADVAALLRFEPGPQPPDLVRGVAGPLWAALHGLERAGVRQEVSRTSQGIRWVLVVEPG
jgi:K+-sensing histidine kinase KdpD